MTCKKCLSDPYAESMCTKCFSIWFEKKLRKEVRESNIEKGDSLEIIDTQDSNFLILDDFLRNKIGLPLKFGKGKKVYPSSLDEKGKKLLLFFFKKGKDKEERINLLTSLTQDNIDKFAELQGYKSKNGEEDKNGDINKMMNRLDDEFKNIKTSLGKSADIIEKVLK
jgi:hypothetical protein